MAIFDRIGSSFRRIAANDRGGTAITFALSIVPLLLAGGAAVDYLRYSEAETTLQAALDSGALAVGASSSLSHDDRIKAGEDTLHQNLMAAGFDFAQLESSFDLAGDTVRAEAHYRMPTSLMHIAGLSQMAVSVSTEISIPEGTKAEIALVLDYSGSMKEVSGGQVKYVAMKNAASKLITDLESSAPDKVKVGLVPFSHHVYVTLAEQFIVGKPGSGSWTGCTQDRFYPHNLTDETPVADDATKWGRAFAKVHETDGCAPYAAKSLKVAPLTSDFASLRSQLDAMRPNAWTHIALGAEFGYHLLSPNEPFAEGASYSDKTFSKVMVLLTDGRQTEPAFGNGTRSVADGESNLEDICANAKASGITVMTVAFDLRDKDTRARLRGCSSDPDKHFFIAEDSAELAGAFEDIKKQITAQVYISR